MFQVLTVLSSIAVCLLSIWAPCTAWIAFGIMDVFFISQLVVMRKLYRIDHFVSSSQEVMALLEKYGHYFRLPFAARDYSASSGTLMFAGIILAAVTWFTGFKWGVVCALANWVLMAYAAHSFSPAAVLAKHPEFRAAHDNIFETLTARRSDGR